jgi:hypothetical protein
VSLVEFDDDDLVPGRGPSVHLQSRLRFLRPATGVSGAESLSDSEESRLSPVCGTRRRGEAFREEKADRPNCSEELTADDDVPSEDDPEPIDRDAEGDAEAVDDVASTDDSVDPELTDDSRSECAKVYLTVLISSSRGVRKETLFSAGKRGREAAILRGIMFCAGLFVRMERRLCGCL